MLGARVLSPGDPAAGRWLANYPEVGEPHELFSAELLDEKVKLIGIRSERLMTEEGVHIGSTMDELTDAYPGLVNGPTGFASSMHYVATAEGMITFEVVTDGEYWPEYENKIVDIRIRANDGQSPGPVVGSDASVGGCI